MKNWIAAFAWLAALAGGSASLHAQARTFDGATFDPPTGWDFSGVSDHIVMTKIDNDQGIFCQLVVYQSQASIGYPAGDFSSEWNAVVSQNFPAAPEPQPRKSRTVAGYVFLEAGSTVAKDNKEYFADLMVFQVGDRVQSILG
jgi:hypothetical protein